MKVAMIIIIYRAMAWVSIGPPFTTETTLEPTRINDLMDALTQALKQVHGDQQS